MRTEINDCARCHQHTLATIMSRFNTDTLCLECATDEEGAPGFRVARQREQAEVQRGNYNFQGVGLSAADREFLAARRAERGVR